MGDMEVTGINRFEDLKQIIRGIGDQEIVRGPAFLTGLSGKKIISTLQKLARYQEQSDSGSYLEVGVFRGLTLLSVAQNVKSNVFGVDNFSQFDPDESNKNSVIENAAALGLENVKLIDKDYEVALESLSEFTGGVKLGVYFVDGPHDYRSQIMCLLLALRHLSERSIIIVDDCNYRHVRQANADFLKSHPQFALLFEAYTPYHPNNMTAKQRKEASDGWWNGINIIVHDPEMLLARCGPAQNSSINLHGDDHQIHSHKYGAFAVSILSIVTFFFNINYNFRELKSIWYHPRRFWRLHRLLWDKIAELRYKTENSPDHISGTFEHANTQSNLLPIEKFNEKLQ